MRVRLLPPFGDGKTWQEISLPREATVRDLVDRIASANRQLYPYLRSTVEETFHHFILIRGDHVLVPGDTLDPDDSIVLVMPLTGG